MGTPILDATARQFLDNPYPAYAEFRSAAPVGYVASPYDTYWVFSHALVAEVNARVDTFLKPGRLQTPDDKSPTSVVNHLKDGLFFMNPPRHGEVRTVMDGIFGAAIENAAATAQKVANTLIEQALAQGQLDAIGGYAGPLASQVFFQVMGVPTGPGGMGWAVLDGWVRAALSAHRETMPRLQRLPGATAGLAMRTYLLALVEQADDSTSNTSIAAGMRRATACPASKEKMDSIEAMNTAAHMALGGYLSTEFLIGTGVYNLLQHPDQWRRLRDDRSLMPRAIDEMLRYDAPFQLADRWVKKGTRLGEVTFEKDTVLAVVYGAANRDPALCADPERFDIERRLRRSDDDPTPNFGFGDGIHRCIGEWLARTVATVAFNTLLDRCPAARIGEVGPWGADPYFRTLSKLQLLLR